MAKAAALRHFIAFLVVALLVILLVFIGCLEPLLFVLFGLGLGFQGCGTTGDTAPGYSNLRLMYENQPLSVVGGLTHSVAVSPTKSAECRNGNQAHLYKRNGFAVVRRQRHDRTSNFQSLRAC